MEGVDVIGVGHHTHLKHGIVAGAAGTCPEGELHGVDGMDIGVKTRKDDGLIVTIGARGGAAIPVEVARAAVGGSAAHIGVAEIGRAVVDVVPAGNLRPYGGRTGGHVFKAVGVRQAVEIDTGRADVALDKCTGGAGALRSHRIVVRRVGREPGKRVAAIREVGDRVGAQDDSEIVASVGAPADGHLVDVRTGGHIKRNIAPFVGQEDVVEGHIGSG